MRQLVLVLVVVATVVSASDDTLYFHPRNTVLSHPNDSQVLCPDKQGRCADGSTCCLLATGGYGCCPLPKAVCCSDHLHCCPHGTTCNLAAGKCESEGHLIPWSVKVPAESLGDVVCPGGKVMCSGDSTCCKLTTGVYGCCPLPKAVCCSDQIHCCPSGYTCSSGSCTKAHPSSPVLSLTAATTSSSVGSVVCPGGKFSCADGQTCCLQLSGVYGCCPMASAVCCSDRLHCCPNGYTCDVESGQCLKSDSSSSAAALVLTAATSSSNIGSVVCPGGQVMCQDGQTCCLQPSGSYGCCPLPSAVCCSDGAHCCPQGTTCDLSAGLCRRQSEVIDWLMKVPATPVPPVVSEDHQCPDKVSSCPSDTTCCKMLNDHYSCCPFPNAVCCKDQLHCCPNGQSCNDTTGECMQTAGVGGKVAAVVGGEVADGSKVQIVTCPDQSTCPDGATCCQMTDKSYGCCPFPAAVCCSDGIHCCPSGYRCDVGGACVRQSGAPQVISVPWSTKLPAQSRSSNGHVCGSGPKTCPDKTTCCPLPSGAWGCCPFDQADCCADGLHCCAHGTTCDATHQRCRSLSSSLSVSATPLIRLPAPQSPVSMVMVVVCPDKSQCPEGTTCCALATGRYGCCPFDRAVCCADHVHCCPMGYTCGTTSCTKDGTSLTVPLALHTRSSPRLPSVPSSVLCPDGKFSCPDDTTCCQLQTGSYGCCPYANATCCPDREHCCPSGHQCEGNQCVPNTHPVAMETLTASNKDEDVVICPDRIHQCPTGSTCCMLVTGQWGCCPLPKAVCCADHLHCCPTGYQCDVKTSTCTKDLNASQLLTRIIGGE